MTQKEVIHSVLRGEEPPYVPWALHFTLEAQEKLLAYYGSDDLHILTGSHVIESGEVDVFRLGFSLYERSWTLRGLKNTLIIHTFW